MVNYTYEQLIEKFTAFTKLLEQQKQVLLKRDYKALEHLENSELESLHQWYQSFFQGLEDGAEDLYQLNQPQKAELKETYEAFAQLLADNIQLLQTKIQLEDAVMQAIYHAITDSTADKIVYGADGNQSQLVPVHIHSVTI